MKISYFNLKILSLFLILSFLSIMGGCSNQYQTEIFAMDTAMTVTAYGKNSETAVKAAQSEINRLDSLLSFGKTDSEISALNSQKSLSPSQETKNLISRAFEISQMTDGDFDITISPLVSLWGFYSDIDNRVPSQDEISAALNFVGEEHININSDGKITLDKNSCIDLGGIAKGYTSARVSEILKANGIDSAIMSLGGNVHALGKKPDGSSWTVAVADPDDSSKSVGNLKISDCAVITSGGYQRYFEKDGKIYHHIIDPKTGYPSDSGLKSVTIVSEDDALADALSTALFVKGLEESKRFYSEHSDAFGAIFVTTENEIYITENLEEKFFSDRKFEVIYE